MPTAMGLPRSATRLISSCPSAESRSASAALVRETNSSMSAPAMKLSALPENRATALTLASRASPSSAERNSAFTAAAMVVTGLPGTSSGTAGPDRALQKLRAGIDGGDGVGPDERERLVSQRARRVFAHQQDG